MKEKTEETLSWHDSFWEEVNIPQLDGTCDDDRKIFFLYIMSGNIFGFTNIFLLVI